MPESLPSTRDEPRCPRHPRFRASDCPACEVLIDRAEAARDEPDVGGHNARAAADRYERWLDSIQP